MNDNQQLCSCMLSNLNVDNAFIKIQNHVLVSDSSASQSPPATCIAVVTYTSAICSVRFRPVNSSGAVPDHTSK